MKFVTFVYDDGKGTVYEEKTVKVTRPLIVLDEWRIFPISVAFIYLKEDSSDVYNMVKMMSQFEFGIPSQCCVQKKYLSARNKEQQ